MWQVLLIKSLLNCFHWKPRGSLRFCASKRSPEKLHELSETRFCKTDSKRRFLFKGFQGSSADESNARLLLNEKRKLPTVIIRLIVPAPAAGYNRPIIIGELHKVPKLSENGSPNELNGLIKHLNNSENTNSCWSQTVEGFFENFPRPTTVADCSKSSKIVFSGLFLGRRSHCLVRWISNLGTGS